MKLFILVSPQNALERSFIVSSISTILDSIKSLSTSIFVFSQPFDILNLLNSVPDIVQSRLLKDDFIYHLDQANSNLQWLLKYFDDEINPHLKKDLKKLKKYDPKDTTIPYADFTIDKPPVFKNAVNEHLNYLDIINKSEKEIKPVKYHRSFSFGGCCPFCGAPKEYIYDNIGRGQFLCKCCRHTFTVKTTPKLDSVEMYCPCCGRKLVPHRDRKGYIVYICQSKCCSYYKENKARFVAGDTECLLTSSKQYRFHYTYRDFKFNLDSLKETCLKAKTKVNLSINPVFPICHYSFHNLPLSGLFPSNYYSTQLYLPIARYSYYKTRKKNILENIELYIFYEQIKNHF